MVWVTRQAFFFFCKFSRQHSLEMNVCSISQPDLMGRVSVNFPSQCTLTKRLRYQNCICNKWATWQKAHAKYKITYLKTTYTPLKIQTIANIILHSEDVPVNVTKFLATNLISFCKISTCHSITEVILFKRWWFRVWRTTFICFTLLIFTRSHAYTCSTRHWTAWPWIPFCQSTNRVQRCICQLIISPGAETQHSSIVSPPNNANSV
jgi:hypothetical protein